MLKLIDARLSNASTSENINFNVYPYGKGLEITDAVIEKITEYKEKHKVEVNMTFKSDLTQGKTPVILKAENCINMFRYNGVNVIIEGCTQTVDEPIRGIANLTIRYADNKNGRLIVNDDLTASGIVVEDSKAWNDDHTSKTVNYMEINDANVTTTKGIHNMGWLKLNADAEVSGGIDNAYQLTIVAGCIVDNIVNNNDCVECKNGKAQIEVVEGATLVVNDLINGENGDVNNKGAINVNNLLTNEGTLTSKESGTIHAKLLNKGRIDNYGLITQYKDGGRSINEESGIIFNHGTSLDEADKDAEIRAARDAMNPNAGANFENNGTIYNYGVFMDLINNGLVYQYKAGKARLYISNGTGSINVTGCKAGKELTEIVLREDKQTFIYDVTKNMATADLAGTSVLNIINVEKATLTVTGVNDFPEWSELNMKNANVEFTAKYTTPGTVNVTVTSGHNEFRGEGANFVDGALQILQTDTHAEIQSGCTMKFRDVKVDGDLKAFGTLVSTNAMTGIGYYNGNRVQ